MGVDQEDPPPAERTNQPAAEDWSKDRGEQHRDAENHHQPTDPFGTGLPGHDYESQWEQYGAAETLDHPEHHQQHGVGRHCAQQ